MIKQLFTAAALAAALCVGGAAQAAVLTFDDPGVVEIENNVATYTEAGFTVSGLAASFLPIDLRLVGGFDATPFSLMLVGGGEFSLRSLDYDFFDLGFGDASSELTITGLLDGITVASRTVNLSGPDSLMFDADWAKLSEVSFSGNAGFSLDNIDALASAVPEPGTLALGCLALLGLGLRRREAKGGV
jgi:hypothetical protein